MLCSLRIRMVLMGLMATAGMTSPVSAITVVGGQDFLTTDSGAFLDFSLLGSPLGLGVVTFAGNPVGPGSSDTIIKRTGSGELSGVGDSTLVQIEFVALSLTSLSPVDVGGTLFTIRLGLDDASPSQGTYEIRLDDDGTPSGSVASFFDVFLELTLVDPSTGETVQALSGLPALHLEGQGTWTSVAPPDAIRITGAPGDVTANTHDPLAPGYFDFYMEEMWFESQPDAGAFQQVRTSIVPEPGTLTLFFLGALGLSLRQGRREGYGKTPAAA